ncbi:hypothetical protein [uncultured Draconibacterium sp.]|uniref:hypothetical protein n=1 Tax=uncultured Draconibacterium sp. TaxID=1573823 RepID=UPI0025EDDB87|nr:hypothetical protein [uncultured Draconibacterium sp.]
MAIVIEGTAYSGEVLEQLLVRATTTNELVERGLIKLVPNVSKKYTLPRLKTGKMLQKRKEQPTSEDAKGDFTYDEKYLQPKEFMAYTEFNPRAFENIWRPFQPKGDLVFAELPTKVQNQLLEEMGKAVDFELGFHFINGEFGDTDDELFNGILYSILHDEERIEIENPVGLTEDNIISKMKAARLALPKKYRKKAKMLLSDEDFEKYDSALTKLSVKGPDYTSMTAKSFKGMPIEVLSDWPEHVIVCTIATNDMTSNLWAGCNLTNDYDTIKIDKVTNAGERYFFKMLMTADTEIAWGEQVSIYDGRVEG